MKNFTHSAQNHKGILKGNKSKKPRANISVMPKHITPRAFLEKNEQKRSALSLYPCLIIKDKEKPRNSEQSMFWVFKGKYPEEENK